MAFFCTGTGLSLKKQGDTLCINRINFSAPSWPFSWPSPPPLHAASMEDDPTTPQERRFLRLDTSLQTAVRGHVNGMKLPLVGTTTQPMLLTLEFITDNMVPWAAHIIKKLGPHFDATTEQTASAAAKLLTTTLPLPRPKNSTQPVLKSTAHKTYSPPSEQGGDPGQKKPSRLMQTPSFFSPRRIRKLAGVLQVLTLSKQQVLIDHVLTHTGLTAIAQIPYNEEEGGEDENPWRDLRNLLVDIPSPSVVDLVARMSPFFGVCATVLKISTMF
ncbi:MAG: hypothetical protein H6925_04595 [Holosporaceae bacterium]|nr:MAG: hypothetical protein H6925_04595 [Holosporaceae bacterium]